uniref:Polyunsaturated fatty acid synthase n=1 Tax=Pseudoalteromonas sp. DS-12 TaxID=375285 RepID=Q1KML0_9GAMM|nr:polyunsaturated fatty acid synthase [Pseudoalteromonas sp. DS-12]
MATFSQSELAVQKAEKSDGAANIEVFWIPLAEDAGNVWRLGCMWLSSDERAKVQRYKFPKARHNGLIVRAFLRAVLSQHSDERTYIPFGEIRPNEWRFEYGDKGKPRLCHCQFAKTGVHFNLSHSGEWLMVAICTADNKGAKQESKEEDDRNERVCRPQAIEFGDIERERNSTNIHPILSHYFSEAETRTLFALPEALQRQRFFDLWAVKESYIKAKGLGLALSLKSFAFDIMPSSENFLHPNAPKSHLHCDVDISDFIADHKTGHQLNQRWVLLKQHEGLALLPKSSGNKPNAEHQKSGAGLIDSKEPQMNAWDVWQCYMGRLDEEYRFAVSIGQPQQIKCIATQEFSIKALVGCSAKTLEDFTNVYKESMILTYGHFREKAVFGTFGDALKNQLGIDNGKIVTQAWHVANGIKADCTTQINLLDKNGRLFNAPAGATREQPHYRLAGGQLNFIDKVIVDQGGKEGLGYLYAERTIDPSDWFFQFHFHQDPVMPGSLGVEAIIFLMQTYAISKDLGAGFNNPKFGQILSEVKWKYRGQINPLNKQMSLDVHITSIVDEDGKRIIVGDANLSKDGLRIYEVKDIAICIEEAVPRGGDTLRYDINHFARNGDTLLFFFSYECFVGDKMVLKMDNGCAGFFTDEELSDGKGVIRTEKEIKERSLAVDASTYIGNKQRFNPLLHCPKTQFDYGDIMKLLDADIGCFGSDRTHASHDKGVHQPSLCFSSEKFLMIEQVSHVDPRTGGTWGLGLIEGHKQLEPDHWYFPCHFKGDQVMAGSLMAEGCGQLLQFYMLYLGMHTVQDSETNGRFQPLENASQKVRCRGQVLPQSNVLTYRMEVTEIGMSPRPYAKANILLNGKVVVDEQNLGVMIKEEAECTDYPGHSDFESLATQSYVASGAPCQNIADNITPDRAKKISQQKSVNAPLMAQIPDLTKPKNKGVIPIQHFEAPITPGHKYAHRVPDTVPFTPYHMFEFATGNIENCFGPDFSIYRGMIPPRTPCGDTQVTTRVIEVNG